MKIIISPAKKMRIDRESYEVLQFPVFLEDAQKIASCMRDKSYEEAKEIWLCNDKIAEENYKRFQEMDLCKDLTPAVIAYEGIQYQYMAPQVMDKKQVEYIKENLFILSGFYGILSAFDGVVPYRMEMQAKLAMGEKKDLYAYWGSRLYDKLKEKDRVFLNLASKEYSKCIEKYLQKEDIFVTCIFGEIVDGKVRQKGTMAKMARGEMVRKLALEQIVDIENIKRLEVLDYVYSEQHSTKTKFVFLKKK
ncbi:MAG TPA: peroxide stress protein YaaA [Lachnospiraceae bacterium]